MQNPVFHRRTLIACTAAAAACIAAPILRAQNKPIKAKLSLLVDGEAALCHLPLMVAGHLGFFRAEGLEVDIVDSSSAAAGLVPDVYAGAFENTLYLQTRNQFSQAFVLQGRAPQIAFGVSTRLMPDYRSPADLRGKKIGVAAMGAPSHMVANVVLAQAGVVPADVRFVEVGSAMGALIALRAGQIDAISCNDPLMGILETKGEVKMIADTRTLKGALDVFGSTMPAACLYAPITFIQKNAATVQALTNAMVHGLKWLQTAGPSDIIKIVPESYFLGDRALYLASFTRARESISNDGLLPDDGPRTAWKALGSFDPLVKAARIDLSKTYTNEYARRAKERFRA